LVVTIKYDLIWQKFIFKFAKKVICVDVGHLKSSKFGKIINANKIVEIFNGVDTSVFCPQPKQARAEKIILFVGNPLPFKRLDWLLKAMTKITDSQAKLVVVSDEYKIQEYKNLAQKLNLENKVIFAGRVKTSEDLAKLYSGARCLVVPGASAAESFSIVAAEALSCSCPVITSDTPGPRSRVTPGVDGLWFKSDQVEDLTRAINEMLGKSEAERSQMGEAGRAKILAEYSLEKHLDKLEKVYKEVI
jgi:glycosyltransferase involved in cell wall biosynthesis